MLVFDKKLLKVTRLNEIVLPVYAELDESTTEGYLYCDLATFQQVVTLNTRFEGSMEALTSLLLPVMHHKDVIDYWAEHAPSPFNMLAPFLGLISDKIELNNDMEELSRYLHVIGRAISFSDFVAIPISARVNVMFGKSSFLMMKEEIRDYKRTLRERERDFVEDGVAWISSEEIERVAGMLTLISDSMPMLFGSSKSDSQKEETEANLDKNGLDTTVDLDDDWSDYIPPAAISTDWGTSSNPMITAAITSVKNKAAKEVAEQEEPAESEDDLLDSLMRGSENAGALI